MPGVILPGDHKRFLLRSEQGILPMGMQDRQLRFLVLLDLPVEGLNNHLAHALRRAHDIGWVDGLVSAHQHKALAAVHHGGITGLVCTENVVLDGLAGTSLHQRHMLVSCRMIHDIRLILFKELIHAAAVPH